jgi:DNA-binding transcriptional MocR family regulator
MRLNFSNAAPERIREGIRRLAAAVKSQLAGAKIHSEQPIEA